MKSLLLALGLLVPGLAWAAAGLDVVTDDGSTGHVA
mgnify:CR=1 FL=1